MDEAIAGSCSRADKSVGRGMLRTRPKTATGLLHAMPWTTPWDDGWGYHYGRDNTSFDGAAAADVAAGRHIDMSTHHYSLWWRQQAVLMSVCVFQYPWCLISYSWITLWLHMYWKSICQQINGASKDPRPPLKTSWKDLFNGNLTFSIVTYCGFIFDNSSNNAPMYLKRQNVCQCRISGHF